MSSFTSAGSRWRGAAGGVAPLALIALGLAACAARSRVWPQDVVLTVLDGAGRPGQPLDAALDSDSDAALAALPMPGGDYGPDQAMLQAIARFQRRVRDQGAEEQRRWPLAALAQWRDFLALGRAYLAREQAQVANLHRLRITLEAELQRDVLLYGPAPAQVADGAHAVLRQAVARLGSARAAQARLRGPGRAPGALIFHWPLRSPSISSFFGRRDDPLTGRERFHAGIDLAAPYGQLVYAAAPGVVVWAAADGGRGTCVRLAHAGAFQTVYAHLAGVLVEPGQAVEAGAPIGLVGDTGRATGPHLHFELRQGPRPLDPLELLEVPLRIQYAGQEGR